MAPADAPTMKSGCSPCSSSARSIPTSTVPQAAAAGENEGSGHRPISIGSGTLARDPPDLTGTGQFGSATANTVPLPVIAGLSGLGPGAPP